MATILSFIALFLSWIFIEVFIFLYFIFNEDNKKMKYVSINKLKWIIRILIFVFFVMIIFYMYFFHNEELKKTIRLCIGLIR